MTGIRTLICQIRSRWFVLFIVAIMIVTCAQCWARTPYSRGDEGLNITQRRYRLNHPDVTPNLLANLGDFRLITNDSLFRILSQTSERTVQRIFEPNMVAPSAKAAGQAQAIAAANAAGELARSEGVNAIDYCSRFLKNFTVQPDSKWNQIRNSIFLPIAFLLLLPGAVLTQMRATISAASPVLENMSPFDGLWRALVSTFLIPGTYLIVNWGIDVSNSVQYTIASEYTRSFGRDMYQDAMCAQVRAFAVRRPSENETSLLTPPVDRRPRNNGPFSQFEAGFWGKLEDPCEGLEDVPVNRDDASMPASAVASRLVLNVFNAGITTVWMILCAFQTAMFYYLFFIGPIMAALWVWPLRQMREGFKNWLEAVVTLCFWSLFWHTTVLLMACFKGVDDTGVVMMSALNFLAVASVKYAFDFTGLVKGAGQEVAKFIEKQAGNDGGSDGGARRRGEERSYAHEEPSDRNTPAPVASQEDDNDESNDLGLNSPGMAGMAAAHGLSVAASRLPTGIASGRPAPAIAPPPLSGPALASSHPDYKGVRVLLDTSTGELLVWNVTSYVPLAGMRVDAAGRVMALNPVTAGWEPLLYAGADSGAAFLILSNGELWIKSADGYRIVDPLALFAPPPYTQQPGGHVSALMRALGNAAAQRK